MMPKSKISLTAIRKVFLIVMPHISIHEKIGTNILTSICLLVEWEPKTYLIKLILN